MGFRIFRTTTADGKTERLPGEYATEAQAEKMADGYRRMSKTFDVKPGGRVEEVPGGTTYEVKEEK
jgi:hypothetical protein